MARNWRCSVALLGLAPLLPSCINVITSTAQPTALERQLLGDYEELDRDLIVYASVRGDVVSGYRGLDALRQVALDARALQRFHEDDLRELKRRGCVGERNDATLVERHCEPTDDPTWLVRRKRVLLDENRAREAILAWCARSQAEKAGKKHPTPAERDELKKTYFRLLFEARQDGDWFEVEPDQWIRVAR